jgi:hypothetical protein
LVFFKSFVYGLAAVVSRSLRGEAQAGALLCNQVLLERNSSAEIENGNAYYIRIHVYFTLRRNRETKISTEVFR